MKIRYIVILALCAIGIVFCVFFGVTQYKTATEENSDLEALRDSIKVFETGQKETDKPFFEPEQAPETERSDVFDETSDVEDGTSLVETGEAHQPNLETSDPEHTLDFAPLWTVNPEIYAWIEIKDTKVDYPVLQSPDNDSKYLRTAYDNTWYIGGSLFTQATYNNIDFNDPVTVIYGHTMMNGTLFGQLQSIYTNPVTFASHDDIIIYLPDEVRHYKVFAAVPFERLHVLDTYDFSVEYWYERFFDKVSKIRSFSACFNKEIMPEFGDRVLILSTCLNENTSKRFLVIAVYRDDIGD